MILIRKNRMLNGRRHEYTFERRHLSIVYYDFFIYDRTCRRHSRMFRQPSEA